MSKANAPVFSIINPKVASTTIGLFAREVKQRTEITAKQDAALQQVVDGLNVSRTVSKAEFSKGTSANNPARAEVKALFDAIQEAGGLSKSMVANYQLSFWIAFNHNIPFARSLFNSYNADGSAKMPKEKGASEPKAGKVTTTTRTEADKTLSKALAQYRVLGLTEFAANMLDLALESLDGFKETILDK